MSELEARLTHEDAEVRRLAIAALPTANPPRRAALLVAGLGDADWRVRKEAVAVAAGVGERWGLLPELVDAVCQGENVGLRNAALEVLERLGPRAANALLVALPRVPASARKFLVSALGAAGGAGVDRLAQLSNDEDPNTAQAALEALARIGGARAEQALRGHLSSDEPVQRLAALEGLERLGAAVRVEALDALLADRLMRRLALGLLGYSDDPAAAAALLEALEDASTSTSTEAARALGRQLAAGPLAAEVAARAVDLRPAARRALRAIASSADEGARRDATWLLMLARDPEAVGVAATLVADDRLPPEALAAIGAWGEGAIGPLLEVERELPPRPRAAALEMASELALAAGGDAYVPRLRAALREAIAAADGALVTGAARGLEVWGEAGDAAGLRDAARAHEPARAAAGRALEELAVRAPEAVADALRGETLEGPVGAALIPAVARCEGEAAFDRVAEALNASDPQTRRSALLALPRLGPARAAELAGFALADEDIDVQAAAVSVLAGLGREGLGVEQLRLALSASAEPVAAGAARALGRLSDRASIPPLREIVAEGRRGVAVAALEALRAMDDDALDELLVEALGGEDGELVKESLRAIAQSPSARRAPRIALALEHPAWDVRQLAAELLAELGRSPGAAGPDVVASLRARAAREPDEAVSRAMRRALEALGGAGEETDG